MNMILWYKPTDRPTDHPTDGHEGSKESYIPINAVMVSYNGVP